MCLLDPKVLYSSVEEKVMAARLESQAEYEEAEPLATFRAT